MKSLFACLIAAVELFVFEAKAADIKPVDSDLPLFELFEPIPLQADNAKVTFEPTEPLLIVSSIRNLILGRDNKGVLVGLNEKDTKTFAELTRRFEGRMLILKTTNNVIEVMRITAPIEDGYIGFKHPEHSAVAEYLRKRFRVAEFKDT